MGRICHHAIVVTSYGKNSQIAHDKAIAICGEEYVSALGPLATNEYRSFMVMPDGSKEGWALSDECESQRAEFVAWLNRQRYSDGSTPYDWALIEYGERWPDHEAVVLDHAWKIETSDDYTGPHEMDGGKS